MKRVLQATLFAMLVLLASTATAQQVRERGTTLGTGLQIEPSAMRLELRPDFQTPRWRLGVEVNNTQTGVVITGVYPNTAAQRQGIEVGDVLIAINGYQVGYVGDTLYDISDEFTLRADRFGRVTLLMQNHRDGRLVNLTVGLDPRDGGVIPILPSPPTPRPEVTATIAGSVTYREAVRLPATARLRVELVEMDRTGREQRVASEYNTRTLGKQKPLFYDLTFRTDRLDPSKVYVVRAFLDVERGLTLYTPSPVQISPSSPPPRLDLVLTAPK
jgi:uncharacterized lipoprotein YbaY